MKLKMKALALALLAVTGSANAAIDLSTTGNSSLMLTIFDDVNNVSFLADLGKNFSDFNQSATNGPIGSAGALGTIFSWDMTTGDYASIFSQFAAVASSSSNWLWAVAATDGNGTGAGSRSFITSVSATGTNIPTNQTQQGIAGFDSYINSNTFLASNLKTVDNGAGYATSGSGYAIGQGYTQAGRFGGQAAGPIAFQTIGTDASLSQFVIAGVPLTPAVRTDFGNGAKFNLASNGILTYSTNPVTPVPEADTWMLMLLGLGLMGYKSARKAI